MSKYESEDVEFLSQVRFNVHPIVQVDTFFTGDTTPDVSNRVVFRSPGGATTVTNFRLGTQGQTIKILGNGNLTISNVDGFIKHSTGGPTKILGADAIYTFTLVDGVWYEETK
jgi:hypothetical protein